MDVLAVRSVGLRKLDSTTPIQYAAAAASAFTYSMVGLLICTGIYHLLVMLVAGRHRAGLEATSFSRS